MRRRQRARAFGKGSWSHAAPSAQARAAPVRRADAREHREELALLETLDMGKPIADSLAVDIPAAARCIPWYAEAIDKIYDEVAPTGPDALALITREPVGVVGAIVPWNFPLLMASWKLGPVLAAGNSLVLKPSEKSPLTAIRVAELAIEAGLPDGVFNVVPGFGQTAGKALALHMDVDCIALHRLDRHRQGDDAVRGAVEPEARVARVRRQVAEHRHGGLSRSRSRAATAAAFAIFFNQGEMCSAGSRLIVEASIKDAVLEKIAAVGRADEARAIRSIRRRGSVRSSMKRR